jgi:hypothetical protein
MQLFATLGTGPIETRDDRKKHHCGTALSKWCEMVTQCGALDLS